MKKNCDMTIDGTNGILEFGQYTYFNEQLGTNCFDFTIYLKYFSDNIQLYEDLYLDGPDNPPIRMYEGMTLNEFIKDFIRTPEQDLERSKEIINWYVEEANHNDFLIGLQQNLISEGKQISFGNLITLARFLYAKSRNRWFALLGPTRADIEESLSSLGTISNVTFTNSKGKSLNVSSESVIKQLITSIRGKKEDEELYVVKLVQWDKVANNSIMQSIFIHDLTQFLHDFFPEGLKRKRGALISTAEQKLIRWAMQYVGLSPVMVTDSRYRQLLLMYDKIDRRPSYHSYSFPRKNDKNKDTMIIPLDFIPWKQWCGGKLDFSHPIKTDIIKIGTKIKIATSLT